MPRKGESFSFWCPEIDQKKRFQEKHKLIKNRESGITNDSGVQALLYKLYFEGRDALDKSKISKSNQEILDEVNCFYLKFEDEQFNCFEKSKDKRNPLDLGIEENYILTYCETCKQGKADKIREQYQKKLRGQNIRGLLQLINLFQKFAEDGVPSTIYFCNRIAENQIFTGLKTIDCTMYNSNISIERCKEKPCQYFEEYTIAIHQAFPEQTLQLIEGIAKDYKRIEDLSPKKQVESKQVDPNDR